ncbi:MAG TPA: DUF4245 family protein [Nocardioides sp.]|nr:DUF4245 family protein [Nocardioides sp.]
MVPTGSPDRPGSTEGPGSTDAPERPGRYQRSSSGMVGALIVTLLVIFAFVAFRALNRTDLEVKPEKIDYLAQVHYAQEAGARPVYPARLPAGWYATTVTFSPGDRSGLELSMLTADGQYAGFVESPASPPQVLTTYVDPHPQAGGPVTVDGSVVSRWEAWTDTGGDSALVAQRGHGSSQGSLLVFGTVPRAQLMQLAASLTTTRVSG